MVGMVGEICSSLVYFKERAHYINMVKPNKNTNSKTEALFTH